MRNLYFTLFFSALIAFSGEAFAQFGGLKNQLSGALGGNSTASSEAASAAKSQDALANRFSKALFNIVAAQEKFALAFGMAEEAAELEAQKNLLAGSPSKDDYKRALAVSSAANEKITEATATQATLGVEGKTKYVEALPLYAKGTYNLVKLGPEASKWLKSAQSEIKGAGVMGLASLKKKLDVGLFIAPKVPGLIKNFTSASGKLVSYGKSNDIDTSGANEASFDDE